MKTLRLLTVMMGLLGFSITSAQACNWSSFCLDSVRPAPGGGYDIYTTLCVGYGNNGSTTGATGNTGRFLFSFSSANPSFAVSQFTNPIRSTYTYIPFSGVNVGDQPAFNAKVGLFYNNSANWFTCITSNNACGNPGIDCKAVQFRTNFLPDSIRVFGIEGGDDLQIGCNDPDMRILFTPSVFDNCCHLNTTTSSTLAGGCGGSGGTATINVTAGLAPYAYTWSTGATGTNTISGLSPGNYQVTVTDAAGCYDTRSISVVAGTGTPTVSVSNNTAATCSQNNGSLSVSGSGGSGGPYSFAWSNGMAGSTISGLQGNANYTVTITDVMGCTQTATFNVGLIWPPSAPQTYNAPERCGQANGALTVTGNGGSGGPFTYAWSSGATTPSISGLNAGTYTVTVTDAAGCFSSATYVVANYTGPTVYPTVSAEVCAGGNNGSISTSTGGQPGTFSYLWSTGATTTGITGLPGGTYTLTLSDAYGCFTVTNYTVPVGISPSLSNTSTDEYCGMNNGTATVVATGGVSPYSYAWSNGQTAATATTLAAGTYSVSVVDAQGCVTNQNVNVNAQAAFTLSSTYTPPGTASTTPTGGFAPYTYNWSNGATTQTVTGLAPGTYTVVVTDAQGCQVSDNVTVLIVVGLNEMAQNGITVAPNPVGDWLQIHREDGLLSGEANIQLYDAQAKLIQQGKMASGEADMRWNATHWAKGVYFMYIEVDGNAFITRLVK